MTRGLLASLLILWDMLDGSLAGQRVGSNPSVGNQNLQKKTGGILGLKIDKLGENFTEKLFHLYPYSIYITKFI